MASFQNHHQTTFGMLTFTITVQKMGKKNTTRGHNWGTSTSVYGHFGPQSLRS